jgi:hypothetical protein
MRPFFLLVLLCAFGCGLEDEPSRAFMTDDQLIALFHDQRASFDSLATMLDEDRFITWADSYGSDLGAQRRWMKEAELARLPHRVPEERWRTYERLFRRCTATGTWTPGTGGFSCVSTCGRPSPILATTGCAGTGTRASRSSTRR